MPARVHIAGAVRWGSILKPVGLARPTRAFSCLRIASEPLTVADVPSQGQHIAPMAVRMKQGLEQGVVAVRKSPFELRKPMLRNRRDGFCSSQHSRSQAIGLRCVSGIRRPKRSAMCARTLARQNAVVAIAALE